MLALALYLASLGSLPANARHCEELGPRLDQTYVTVCDGSVVRVRDRQGNVRTFSPRWIATRSGGEPPVVLTADGR